MDSQNPIHAQLLDGKGAAVVLDESSMAKWEPQDGSLWVHLNYDDDAIEWLNNSSGLDELVVGALTAAETRPRVVGRGDGLIIALRGVNLNPGANPEDMVSIRIWIDADRIVTTRKRELLSVADIEAEFKVGKGPVNSADFIVVLADKLVDRVCDVTNDLEDVVADLEERVLGGDNGSLRYDLATVRRQAIAIRRYLSPQREALSRLYSEKVSWLDEASRFRLREVNDRLIRSIEDLDVLRERAAVTQEELQSRHSEQINSRMYVLSVVAAIFLPLGFLTGLLGVNVGGIPGTDNPNAFMIFVVALIVVVVLQVMIFRWRKWM
jgi:zinc transporter